MAGTKHILLLPLLFTLVVARGPSDRAPKTSLFDVSASIQQTLDVLNYKPPSSSHKNVPTTDSLSLSLHPRSSVIYHGFKDYESLVLSRLDRDAARVNYINSMLESALLGSNNANMSFDAEEIESTPLTSGASLGTPAPDYIVRLGVGQPVKTYYMAIDTGSSVTWLQCLPCSKCYNQSDAIYDPTQSSTYNALSCESTQCSQLTVSGCSMDTCLYQVTYGDNSNTTGDLVTETVTVGSTGFPDIAIGCGHDNEGLFTGFAGLLGLDRRSLSFASQINATSLSYCLVNLNSQSASTLDFNSPIPSNSATVPLVQNPVIDLYYYVPVTGITVGVESLAIPSSLFQIDNTGNGGIILDSGTPLTRLPTQAYNSLRDSFVRQATTLKSSTPFAQFDTCFDLSGTTSVQVPTISLQFQGGTSLELNPSGYLTQVDLSGKFCLAFLPITRSPSIIGSVQVMGTRFTFDLTNSVVGFTPNNC